MKRFVGHIIDKVIKSTPRSKKVSLTIKSVKPNLKKTGTETRSDEYRRRYKALDKAEDKLKTGKKMMKEGQKERKKLVDTGRAFQFKNLRSYHAVQPGNKNKYNIKVEKKQKKFRKGKDIK